MLLQLHAAGARVIVQDEASSVVWGMPGFVVQSGIADAIVPLAGLSAEIERRLDVGRVRAPLRSPVGVGSLMLAEQDFRYIRDLVRERAAIVLDPGKEYLAVTRLDPLVRRAGLGSLSELVTALREERTSALHEEVVDALTTNETTWFRDFHPFERLRTHVLPDLIERKRLSRTLSIWSAGCSSGQEPYSLAMLLREDFPELDDWQISIVGTDVSAAMLERARRGCTDRSRSTGGCRPTSW